MGDLNKGDDVPCAWHSILGGPCGPPHLYMGHPPGVMRSPYT